MFPPQDYAKINLRLGGNKKCFSGLTYMIVNAFI